MTAIFTPEVGPEEEGVEGIEEVNKEADSASEDEGTPSELPQAKDEEEGEVDEPEEPEEEQ